MKKVLSVLILVLTSAYVSAQEYRILLDSGKIPKEINQIINDIDIILNQGITELKGYTISYDSIDYSWFNTDKYLPDISYNNPSDFVKYASLRIGGDLLNPRILTFIRLPYSGYGNSNKRWEWKTWANFAVENNYSIHRDDFIYWLIRDSDYFKTYDDTKNEFIKDIFDEDILAEFSNNYVTIKRSIENDFPLENITTNSTFYSVSKNYQKLEHQVVQPWTEHSWRGYKEINPPAFWVYDAYPIIGKNDSLLYGYYVDGLVIFDPYLEFNDYNLYKTMRESQANPSYSYSSSDVMTTLRHYQMQLFYCPYVEGLHYRNQKFIELKKRFKYPVANQGGDLYILARKGDDYDVIEKTLNYERFLNLYENRKVEENQYWQPLAQYLNMLLQEENFESLDYLSWLEKREYIELLIQKVYTAAQSGELFVLPEDISAIVKEYNTFIYYHNRLEEVRSRVLDQYAYSEDELEELVSRELQGNGLISYRKSVRIARTSEHVAFNEEDRIFIYTQEGYPVEKVIFRWQDGELQIVEIELRSKAGYLLKGNSAIRHKW